MTESGGVGRWVTDTFKRSLDNARGSARAQFTLEGYEHAAKVSLTVVDGHIERLNKKVRSGGKLTQQEVFLLTSLNDLKKDIEKELPYAWEQYVLPSLGTQS